MYKLLRHTVAQIAVGACSSASEGACNRGEHKWRSFPQSN